jgi:hypothetical protein
MRAEVERGWRRQLVLISASFSLCILGVQISEAYSLSQSFRGMVK